MSSALIFHAPLPSQRGDVPQEPSDSGGSVELEVGDFSHRGGSNNDGTVTELEHMEIAGAVDDSEEDHDRKPASKAHAVSSWIRSKIQNVRNSGGDRNSGRSRSRGGSGGGGEQREAYEPLTASSHRMAQSRYFYDSHNDEMDSTRQVKHGLATMTTFSSYTASGGGDGRESPSSDREESSSSSNSSQSSPPHGGPQLRKKRRSSSNTLLTSEQQQQLAGIEVEIGSSVGNDDCLYRKRLAGNVWYFHKRQILLGVAFLLVWLFGIIIGACGSGQCGGSDNDSTNVAALQAGTSVSCNGEASSGGGGSTTNVINSEGSSQALGGTTVVDGDTPTLSNSNNNNNPSSSSASTTNTNGGDEDGGGKDQQQQPAVSAPIVVNASPNFLGPNVMVFDPSMPTAEIQSKVDMVFRQQQNNEMGEERYSLLFQPGMYGSVTEPLMIQIGYYTEVAGLGQQPTDVRILGKIEVYNRCFEADPYQDGKFIPTSNSEEGLCFALNSFWRGLANLSIQIIKPGYQDSCRATAMFWAISQAASMRRVNIEGGDVSLMDYCSNPAYASGGFIADSKIGGKIVSGSQQQFLTRNSNIGEWSGAAWNQVLVGVAGAPGDDSGFPDPAITTFETNPSNREKPYLYINQEGAYHVFVPSFSSGTKDVSWSTEGGTPGKSIPIADFFVAKPGDSIATMNEHLASGKHLLLTPGVYDANESILVERADTVVLGIGIATLTAVDGAVPMKVSSQPGIIVAGVTFDGGLTLSPVLLQVGALGDPLKDNGDPNNPITLSDIYFRIGGPHIGKSNVCLEINSNHVLVDHTWVWRADHGIEDFDKSDGFDGDNERWATNTGLNGVIVNGNDVTATGLFVEHFQEYNLCWNGERGRVYFFQNELPYEPPNQAEWTADDGTLGWAAYKVSENVMQHELNCGGVYCYNRNNPDVVTTNAFEVPNRDGVTLNRIYTRNLSGPGTIEHIVNGVGRSVTDAEKGPFYVITYP